MAVYLTGGVRSHRRPNTRALNEDSPLTRGLQNYWPFVAGTGYLDLRTQQPLTPSSSHAWAWGGHPTLGHSLYMAAVGNSVFTTGLSAVAAPWTFHVWWHRIATGGTASFFTSAGSGTATGVRGEQFGGSGAVGMTLVSTNYTWTGKTVATDRAVSLCIVCNSANPELFLDGVSQGTIASGSGTLDLARIGNNYTTLDRPPLGWWGAMGVWTRALSYGEVRQLADPPTRWQLEWEPTMRSTFSISDVVFSDWPSTVTAGVGQRVAMVPSGMGPGRS